VKDDPDQIRADSDAPDAAQVPASEFGATWSGGSALALNLAVLGLVVILTAGQLGDPHQEVSGRWPGSQEDLGAAAAEGCGADQGGLAQWRSRGGSCADLNHGVRAR
jgi:hypothetical protein